MKGDVEEEAPRPRPLSGGIWTLFSWLRRTERSSSDESITSVGSDRTTASFDYLSPLHYKRVNSPLVLPQSPLTETYKKRLHERNLRRQFDRDITLRRKYGLYTEEGLGYDAFSLPPARKILKDSEAVQGRQRRATSESVIQPRAAYVPGKRRAPLPPNFVISASLPRNYKRKRPAPKPPVKLIERNKENVEIRMDAKHLLQKHSSDINNMTTKFRIEKPDKKEDNSKDVKLRTEKGFLKQIFDNRKRNSAIDTSHIKVLPSISELDKQAAEIIQINKLNTRPESLTDGNWICTNCFRNYNTTAASCVYCINRKSKSVKEDKSVLISSSNMCTQTENLGFKSTIENVVDEKKKLREMLKEMKDSLPKRPKQNEKIFVENKNKNISETETPTLRIGSTLKEDKKNNLTGQSAKMSEAKITIQHARDAFLTSQPSTSKQMPRSINGVNNKDIEVNESLSKFDTDSLQSSSSGAFLKNNLKESGKNTTLGIEKNIAFDNVTGIISKNKYRKADTPGESELVAKSISYDIDKYNLNSTNNLGNISRDNPAILQEKPKIASKNIIVESNRKIDNSSHLQAQIKTTENIINKDNIMSQTTQNIKGSQIRKKSAHLFPIKENEISSKSDLIPNKKIERIRLGDVLPLNAVQKIENNNSSSKTCKNIDLNTPLKISSLLNPLYTPKYKDSSESLKVCQKPSNDQVNSKEKVNALKNKLILQPNTSKLSGISESDKPTSDESKEEPVLNATVQITDNRHIDHHAQRRDLINQLEQSIAKGDEQTAAIAAAKLAKLKLACSVLSFSSQIVSGPLLSLNTQSGNNDAIEKTNRILQTNKLPIQNTTVGTKLKETVPPQEKSETSKINNTFLGTENKTEEVQKLKDKTLDNPIPSTSRDIQDQKIPVDVWIEDKEATRGPILLLVSRSSLVSDLKKQAEKSLGLQIRLQRWIIGKTLCSNDTTPLNTLAGPDLTAPFYLCLVESDSKTNIVSEAKEEIYDNTEEPKNLVTTDVYTELMRLEQQALVSNTEEFECGVCIENCPVGKGVVLRECIHTFCKDCLVDSIRHCQEPVVACPAIACPGALQEREIRGLLSPEDYEKWLARSLAAAESGTRNTFHCRTRDCTGWAFCEPGVRRFPCPVCKHTNCLPCQAIHEDQTCGQYQAKLREAVSAVEISQTDNGTQAFLKSLIDKGEALECPECKAIITKKWGCDWIKCSACKTEICWVTKGRRWGPGGKGDTSGGCRCGVDGKRCHPSCAYCH